MAKSLIFFLILTLLNLHAANAQTAAKDDKLKSTGTIPTYLLSGEANLTSNYIEHGLSMSNNSPAINTSLMMNLGSQFKFGFWGSNVSQLDSSNDNLLLRLVGNVLVDVRAGLKFIFYVNDEHYYTSGNRNGQRFGVNVFMNHSNILFEFMTNFEGTHSSGLYGQYKYDYIMGSSYGADLAAGYTHQSSTTYKDYLDLYAASYYKFNDKIRGDLGVVLPSTSQFGSRSKFNYFIKLNLQW